MKRVVINWCLSLLSAFSLSTGTLAQERLKIPPCEPSLHPLQCYADSSYLAVMFSQLLAKSAVNANALGRITHDEMLSAMSADAKRYRDAIEPRFEAAADRFAGNKDALNLLKDYHAFWLGTMDNMMQSPSRQAERNAMLEDKKNRLLLEK